MKYDKILEDSINNNIDEGYAKFHSGLVPGSEIKGVRIPVLRNIAKKFFCYDDFLENVSLTSYEAISVACYYIGGTTKDIKLLKTRVMFILPHINNWAVCDTFVASIKILKKKDAEFLEFLYGLFDSPNNFAVRFAIVCLLSYYLDDSTIDYIFKKIEKVQARSFYIDMAIAWLVSVAFVKCHDKTLNFLKSKKLTKFVQNKSISKICDSFRVSAYDKNLAKILRIKE